MKKLILFALAALLAASATSRAAQPFRRAVVFSGFTMNAPLFIGLLSALEEEGRPADVVVTSCGGSIAGAIANAFATNQERLDFVRSRAFYEMLRDVRMADPTLTQLLRRFQTLRQIAHRNALARERGQGPRYLPPGMFRDPLVQATDQFERFSSLQRPLRADTVRWIAVGTRIEFPVGADGSYALAHPLAEKLLTEVFFTDSETARSLQGVRSSAANAFPDSFLNLATDVVTDAPTIAKALQAAISEPILMLPTLLNGRYYLGGPSNMDPMNVATAVAGETIGMYKGPFDGNAAAALEATYDFSPNRMRAIAMRDPSRADYWVDFSREDFPLMAPTVSFNATANPNRLGKFGFSVPATYEAYLEMADGQIRLARARAQEALRQERFSQRHIRRPL